MLEPAVNSFMAKACYSSHLHFFVCSIVPNAWSLEVLIFSSVSLVSNCHFTIVEETNESLPCYVNVALTTSGRPMQPYNVTSLDAHSDFIFHASTMELLREE